MIVTNPFAPFGLALALPKCTNEKPLNLANKTLFYLNLIRYCTNLCLVTNSRFSGEIHLSRL